MLKKNYRSSLKKYKATKYMQSRTERVEKITFRRYHILRKNFIKN